MLILQVDICPPLFIFGMKQLEEKQNLGKKKKSMDFKTFTVPLKKKKLMKLDRVVE